MNKKVILLTGLGGPTAQGVLRCLLHDGSYYLIGVDSEKNCPNYEKVDKFFVIPRVEKDEYIKTIGRIAKQNSVNVIIPTLHKELEVIGKLREVSAVLAWDQRFILKILNKFKLYKVLQDNYLSQYIPRYQLLDDLNLLDKKISSFGFPNFPVCLKPAIGHGGMGFRVIGSERKVAKEFMDGQISNWCTLDELKRLLKYCTLADLMLVEYLPGEEYSVDVLVKEGKVLLAVPRKRIRVSNGIVIRGVLEEKQDLITIAHKIIPKLKANYFANLQFKYSKDGVPKLIDINPRFCGSQIMALGGGVNFPLLCLKIFFNEDFKLPKPLWGVEMVRYWESVFFPNKITQRY